VFTSCRAVCRLGTGIDEAVLAFVTALLSFAESAPRAPWLKVGNAFPSTSTSSGTFPPSGIFSSQCMPFGVFTLPQMPITRNRQDAIITINATRTTNRRFPLRLPSAEGLKLRLRASAARRDVEAREFDIHSILWRLMGSGRTLARHGRCASANLQA
jgi:hypothetical protein